MNAKKAVKDEDNFIERNKAVLNRYEKEAEVYDDETYSSPEKKIFNEIQCRIIENTIGFDRTNKILDVGSGTGRFLEYFGNKGYDIYGVEPSKNMNRVARRKLKHLKPKIKKGTIENIPYPDNYFDRVITMHTIMHLHPATIRNGIKEMHRVLKPDGYMVLDFPHKNGVWNIIGKILYKRDRTRMYSKKEVMQFVGNLPYKLDGMFSYPTTLLKYKNIANIIRGFEIYTPLPLMFRSQLLLLLGK